MVLPIIIYAIVAGVVGFCGGCGIAILKEKIGGKKIVLLGPRTAGKTTLSEYLSTGYIHSKYKQTVQGVTKKGRLIAIKELKLKISKIEDVPGAREYYRQWKDAFEKSDIVLYLFRADEIWERKAETEKRIYSDLEHISKWIKENNDGKLYLLVGTHCDLIPGFSAEFYDKLIAMPAIKKFRLRMANSNDIIFGNMVTVESTEILTYYILNFLAEKL